MKIAVCNQELKSDFAAAQRASTSEPLGHMFRTDCHAQFENRLPNCIYSAWNIVFRTVVKMMIMLCWASQPTGPNISYEGKGGLGLATCDQRVGGRCIPHSRYTKSQLHYKNRNLTRKVPFLQCSRRCDRTRRQSRGPRLPYRCQSSASTAHRCGCR